MQFGNNALLMASYGGSVEVVRMLLEEFNSSLDKVNYVSVYFTICITALISLCRQYLSQVFSCPTTIRDTGLPKCLNILFPHS